VPAEELIKSWEGSEEAGYFSSLLTAIGDVSGVPCHLRLLAAILAKNAVPAIWGRSRSDEEVDGGGGDSNGSAAVAEDSVDPDTARRSAQRTAERSAARSSLPRLLLSEPDDRIALHLRLATANAALFDYPSRWPTLLSDLASVSESLERAPAIRVRCAKAVRDVLCALRHRKLIVKDGGPGGVRTLLALRRMAAGMAEERRRTQEAVVPAFGPLGARTWERARNFMTGGPGWEIDGALCGTYLKACGELLPMVASHGGASDDVGAFLGPAGLFLRETKSFFAAVPPDVAAAAAAGTWTCLADKAHRAALNCCTAAIECCPTLFAPHFPLCLRTAADAILELDRSTLGQIPVKRLAAQARFVRAALYCQQYDPNAPKGGFGGVGMGMFPPEMMVMLGQGGRIVPPPQALSPPPPNGAGGEKKPGDPAVAGAKEAVGALLGPELRPRLVEALVTKYLRLTLAELEEWDVDPEGRFQSDEAERTMAASGSEPEMPRHCGGIVLTAMMAREREGVGDALLALASTYQRAPPEDADGMLNREACYHALEICRGGLSPEKFSFADWWRGELLALLGARLTTEGHPAPMRAMQARAVKAVHAFGRKIPEEDFGAAFQSVAALLGAPDLVTSLVAARCLHSLALLFLNSKVDGAEGRMTAVRENSVPALGNAFALANRVSSDECLKASLTLVSGLVEANGTSMGHCLPAVAEQLPPLWERAGDSVPVHSCLIAVLNHLVMKLGYPAAENAQVQGVLFPLLDYCTDVTVPHRAETLLEDGLKLWLVVMVTSRLETMGQSLRRMLPRLEAVLRSGMEAHLSLQVLQFYSILLGPGVVESVGDVVRGLLVQCMSCIHNDYTGDERRRSAGAVVTSDSGERENEEMTDDNDQQQPPGQSATGESPGAGGTLKDAVGALSFMEALLQLSPPVGYAVCTPALSEAVRTMLRKPLPLPLVEALYGALGRLLWNRPAALDEMLGDDPDRPKKVASLVRTWLRLLLRPVFLAALDRTVATTVFMERKGAALSLCAVVCHSAETAASLGSDVAKFTEALKRNEDESNPDVEALVEAACGTSRKLVGDGPLGDAARRSVDMLKGDPLLTTSLHEALDNVRRAVEQAGASSMPS